MKTTNTHEPATTAQVKTKPGEATGDEHLAWTWFIENPRTVQPFADQAGTRSITPSREARSWSLGPTATLLILYLVMVLGVACILALELHGSADNAPAKLQHVPSDLVPAAIHTSLNSSLAGGALTRDE